MNFQKWHKHWKKKGGKNIIEEFIYDTCNDFDPDESVNVEVKSQENSVKMKIDNSPRIKVHLSDYKPYDGTFKAWKKWKRMFLATVHVHKMGVYVSDRDYIPTDAEETEMMNEASNFLYCALEYSCAGSNAITTIEKFKKLRDGIGAFLELYDWIESQGLEDYNVEYAWRVIKNHKLTPNGNGEKFINDYELAVSKLIDENEVVSD